MATITPELARMARAALNLSIREVSAQMQIHHNTLQKYESAGDGNAETVRKIKEFYETKGLRFLKSRSEGGPGIRYNYKDINYVFVDYWVRRVFNICAPIVFKSKNYADHPRFNAYEDSDGVKVDIITKEIVQAITADAGCGFGEDEDTIAAIISQFQKEAKVLSEPNMKDAHGFFQIIGNIYTFIADSLAEMLTPPD